MNKTYTLLSAAAVCLLCLSCQKTDMGDPNDEGSVSRLSFMPTVSVLHERNNADATKGALINEDGTAGAFDPSKSFFVTAFDGATSANIIPGTAGTYQEVKKKGSQWNTVYTDGGSEYCQEYLWKAGETKTFYAYANLPESGATIVNADATGQTLTYTVPASVADQTDILMGLCTGDGRTGPSGSEQMTGTALLSFVHPLAAVRFKLGAVTGTASFEVNSIAVENVYGSGSVTQSASNPLAAEWTDLSSTITVSQTVTTQPTIEAPDMGEAFMLIPQTFSATATARIAMTCTVDGKLRTVYSPLGGETWTAGSIHTYTLSYNGHEGIQLWEDGPYWSSKNVGAEKPEDYGWYFAWGETTGYVTANVSATPVQTGQPTYKCDFMSAADGAIRTGGFSVISYAGGPSSSIPVGDTYDAAQHCSGVKWRMPAKDECEDLIANTTMSYTTRNGVEGFLFTGMGDYSNRSIFIPATGWANGAQISHTGLSGLLWTSTKYNYPLSMELGYNSGASSPSAQDDRTHAGVVEDQNTWGGRAIRAVENTTN